VAALSGHECAQVPNGAGYCDNLVRVISPTDNNVIKVGGVIVATLNKGQVHEFRLQDSAVIEGSSAVLVARYLKGQTVTSPAISDPSVGSA